VFAEDELLPLSALQHLLFCERQCALIHVEQIWVENAFTVEGRHLHDRVDAGPAETRGEVHTARGLPLRSLRLGLSGKADCVEFHRLRGTGQAEAQADAEAGALLPGLAGRWQPFPVEYKRGIPKSHRADEVQLCAQALCLEEMLGAAVRGGALFYGRTRRRLAVDFDPVLRGLTSNTAARLHALIAAGRTPRARREPKCASCSLLDVCMPDALSSPAGRYLDDAIRQADRDLP
jgi:CRISPR-associated exonuclease Cas4